MGLLLDMYGLAALVALVTLAYVAYEYYRSMFSYWKVRGVPHVKPKFISGVIMGQLLGRKSFFDIHMDVYKDTPDASAVGYFELAQPKLMIRDPDLVEKVLIKDFASFHDRGIPYDMEIEPLTGNLINVEGSYWRNLRYKLTPAFTTGKLKTMFEQMSNCADNLVKHIDKQLEVNNDRSFQGQQLIHLLSVDVISSCAFGLEFNSESEQGRLFRKMIKDAFAPSVRAFVSFLLMAMAPKLAKMLKVTTVSKEVNQYFMDITKETIKSRRSSGVKRNDFLQLILTIQEQERNNKLIMDNTNEEDAVLNQLENAPVHDNNEATTQIFTDECLAAQCFSFLVAGAESTSIVTSYCLYALAANPHVQQKLQAEVDTVLGKHQGQWSYQAVKEMKYLNQVISETNRRYPSVGFLLRKCTKPFQIPDSEHVVEPGTHIIVPLSCLQLDDKYFPDPFTFDPERFAEGRTIPKNTFMPFGDGPRICIGMRFAQLEVKVCIAHIVSTLNIRVNKKTIQPFQFEPYNFFIVPKGGIWLDFDKRVKP